MSKAGFWLAIFICGAISLGYGFKLSSDEDARKEAIRKSGEKDRLEQFVRQTILAHQLPPLAQGRQSLISDLEAERRRIESSIEKAFSKYDGFFNSGLMKMIGFLMMVVPIGFLFTPPDQQ